MTTTPSSPISPDDLSRIPKPWHSARAVNLLLLAILMLAAALRFYALAGQSFWADEGNSVVLADQGPAQIITAAAADIHPPAYYLLLAAWGKVFGLAETGARSLSAIIGVALVAVLYALGRRLRGSGMGLVAASLAAVNPFLIYYSQEARMYELLALCAAVTALALVLWTRTSTSRVLASFLYVSFAILGLYTHYAFPIHLLALNLVFLLWLWKTRATGRATGAFLLAWMLLQAVVILFYLPWLPTALRQLGNWPAPSASLGPVQALVETIRLFTCGPTPCPPASALSAIAALLSVALLVVAVLPIARGPRRSFETYLPLVWLLAPLAAMLVLQIFSPVFFKFLLIAVPAYLLLLALGNEKLAALIERGVRSGRPAEARYSSLSSAILRLPVLLLLVLPAVPALDRYYHDPEVARDDYRGLAAYLRTLASPEDAIILDAPGQLDAFSQYDHGAAQVYPLPGARPPDPAATQVELDRILATARRIYAIYWATEQADPDGLVEQYLATHAFKAWDAWVGNLRFVAYSAEPPPAARPLAAAVLVGDAFELIAAGFSGDEQNAVQPGDIAQVLLQWRSLATASANYKVTLQLLDVAGQVAAQVDSEPAGGARPTSAWRPGDEIADPYGLAIPLATPPGLYRLILAVYDPATGSRLPIQTGASDAPIADHLDLGAIRIDPPAVAPPTAILPVAHRAETQAGPFTFLGHDRFKQGFDHAPDTPVLAGDTLHLNTYWSASQAPGGDYMFDLLLDDRVLGRFPLAGSAYPTSQWRPGLPWRGEISVVLPPDMATSRNHMLSLQLVDADGQPVGQPIPLKPALRY